MPDIPDAVRDIGPRLLEWVDDRIHDVTFSIPEAIDHLPSRVKRATQQIMRLVMHEEHDGQ